MRPKWFLSLWYVWRKPCTNLAPTLTLSPNGLKQDSTWPTWLGVPSGASKTISKPMIRSAQVMHLSCVNISTISKWTKSCFQLSLLTSEYHWVRPKWFLSLWYVWDKLCAYLALKLTLSPNRPKRDSMWPTLARSSIKCVQNNFWACVTCEPCTYLASRLALSPNGLNRASTWASSPRSTIWCVQNDF
jgi:hypothetical protein